MDPIVSLATSAVAMLAPYLAEAGHEFAKEAGKAAVNKISVLYTALKNRFKKKSSAKEALADLEANPENQDAQAALRLQLVKQLTTDKSFAESLRKMIDEIGHDQASQTFLTQVYGGDVGQIINATRIDTITFHKKSPSASSNKKSE